MKAITDTFIAYRLAWVRVSLYFLIPAATAWLAQTETWSQATWDETGIFIKVRVMIISCVAGSGGIAAFLDQSLKGARETAAELKQKRVAQAAAENTGP